MNSRISVILADSNEDYRRVLQQTMQRSGEFSVVGSSGNGTEVWELVKRRAPQLVVMDMVLPGLSGLELLDQFSAMPRRPKAIMVSAFCQKQAVSRSLELGASAFISKPCETRTVLSQMRRVIRQSDPGGTESAAIEKPHRLHSPRSRHSEQRQGLCVSARGDSDDPEKHEHDKRRHQTSLSGDRRASRRHALKRRAGHLPCHRGRVGPRQQQYPAGAVRLHRLRCERQADQPRIYRSGRGLGQS